MSRAINLPSQSVKLTNVATVRLTVNGKRFEVACYKNKVLDYRAGLEKDLTEVLQTSNIHVFTNVGKGQFAASADLHAAFGVNATQEEIAVQILLKGKSLQVSEGERTQLYESCLTQVATQIATNCLHPDTGKPYTVTQIKHALTQHHGTNGASTTTSEKVSKKGKKAKTKGNSSNPNDAATSNQHVSFTIQPHKPIKQQYLQALKYLQAANILPIIRAGMELQWEYETSQEAAVVQALQQLEITSVPSSTHEPTNETISDATTATRVFTVDPSVYRPLQELALLQVPGSRLEILRQQVFQASAVPLATPRPINNSQSRDTADMESKPGPHEGSDDDDSSVENDTVSPKERQSEANDSDSDNSDDLLVLQQRNKAKKKQMKKVQRRRVLQNFDSDEEEEVNDAPPHNPNQQHVAASSLSLAPVSVVTNGKPTVSSSASAEAADKMISCNTCVGASFATQSEYRAHFRSDWHRFNQKLKLQGVAAISLLEFEQCDSESFFATTLDN